MSICMSIYFFWVNSSAHIRKLLIWYSFYTFKRSPNFSSVHKESILPCSQDQNGGLFLKLSIHICRWWLPWFDMLRESTAKSHSFRLGFEVLNPCRLEPRSPKLSQSHSLLFLWKCIRLYHIKLCEIYASQCGAFALVKWYTVWCLNLKLVLQSQ